MRTTMLASTLLTACAMAVSPEEVPSLPAPEPAFAEDASVPEVTAWDIPRPSSDHVTPSQDAGTALDPADGAAPDTALDVAVDEATRGSDAAADAPRSNRRVLVVTLDDATQRACGPHGWTLVTWDPAGVELPPSDPGGPLRVEFPWSWRGMLGVGMRCESGYPAYYRDLSPHLGDLAARAGVRDITIDGRDITMRTRVCDPPWVRSAHPDWPVAWRTVFLVPIEAVLEGVCPM